MATLPFWANFFEWKFWVPRKLKKINEFFKKKKKKENFTQNFLPKTERKMDSNGKK